MFPTPLRGTGMNVSVMVSTLVTMTGPYVVDLVGRSNKIQFSSSITFLSSAAYRPFTENLSISMEDIVVSLKDMQFSYFCFSP